MNIDPDAANSFLYSALINRGVDLICCGLSAVQQRQQHQLRHL
jgi:hypothetical protein